MPNHISRVSFFEESCSVVSSAKRIVKNFDALGRSLIRIRNKIGPNIDPCGTPQEISLSEYTTFSFFCNTLNLVL